MVTVLDVPIVVTSGYYGTTFTTNAPSVLNLPSNTAGYSIFVAALLDPTVPALPTLTNPGLWTKMQHMFAPSSTAFGPTLTLQSPNNFLYSFNGIVSLGYTYNSFVLMDNDTGDCSNTLTSTTTLNIDLLFTTPVAGGAPCFVAGTQLLRSDGTVVSVDALRPGDLVQTGDGRAVPVIKVASFTRPKAPHKWLPVELTPVERAPAAVSGIEGAGVVGLSPGHAVWEPKARAFRMAASYVDAADPEVRSWTARVCTENLGLPMTYWHVQLPDFATDSLMLPGGMITEALDGGSTVEPEHKRGSGWIKAGIHPLQRCVRMFAPSVS